jgi:hypothetical protein
MKTNESNPKDWFWLAKERLESADALIESRGVRLSAFNSLCPKFNPDPTPLL